MERPFNLSKARLSKVNGRLNKNFPPKARRTASPIDPKKIIFLRLFDIFLEDVFATDFNKK